MSFDFESELKKLPAKPGVYIMHGEGDEIIYVGKAVSLRNRVRQYFRPGQDGRIKIEKMMPHVTRFEYIVTDSELEALILENNLIKEHSPKYNTMLKDGKTYPFIRVTLEDDYPRLLFSRQMKKNKSKYYGPFTSAAAVKDTIDLLQKLYHIRNCNRTIDEAKPTKPCLYYQMKMCDKPCDNGISKEEYRKNVDKAIAFLEGDYKGVVTGLTDKMNAASEEMNFEDAAIYRDLIESVKHVIEKQKINNSDFEDRDIVAMATEENDAVVQVFFIRNGRMMGREHVYMTIAEGDGEGDILESFLTQYYGGTPYLPHEIMTEIMPENALEIEEWLSKRRGKKLSIVVPKIGKKEKLVNLAKTNATMLLKQNKEQLKREEARTKGAMRELSELLKLPPLSRVEAFDISNISGFLSVGSMVVFEDGKPKKNDYRKFRLKTVSGPDDYASMYEVLTRRFTHGLAEAEELASREEDNEYGSFTRFPDVIFMDGGKGQVSVAERVMAELKLDIPIAGMVKDDNHRTRGIYYKGIELPIDTGSEGFKLLTRIQDEAHRFAIEYHRMLRSKNQVHSVLDDIPNVGAKRRNALMKAFESLEELKKASVEDILKVPGFNKLSAQSVFDYMHTL